MPFGQNSGPRFWLASWQCLFRTPMGHILARLLANLLAVFWVTSRDSFWLNSRFFLGYFLDANRTTFGQNFIANLSSTFLAIFWADYWAIILVTLLNVFKANFHATIRVILCHLFWLHSGPTFDWLPSWNLFLGCLLGHLFGHPLVWWLSSIIKIFDFAKKVSEHFLSSSICRKANTLMKMLYRLCMLKLHTKYIIITTKLHEA